MDLPAPIDRFFEAATDGGGDAPLSAFALDAVVLDENRTHCGHAAIAAWWRASHETYAHTAEPCDLREAAGRTVVRARVTGRFPGSPALLSFAFTLRDARIAALEIGA